MSISVLDLFTIGIGPSSSHTVGPMLAAYQFSNVLKNEQHLAQVEAVTVTLYGSLSATGRGHHTDLAVIAGLNGYHPETVDPSKLNQLATQLKDNPYLQLAGTHPVYFVADEHLVFSPDSLSEHPNALTFIATDVTGNQLATQTYFSIGGGFIVDAADWPQRTSTEADPPYCFRTGTELLQLCKTHNLRISELMLANERIWRSEGDIKQGILKLWATMQTVVQSGIKTGGILPGGLNIKRRAPDLFEKLQNHSNTNMITRSLEAMDWVNLYALATNEENAAGGRIVTAPTNGAAGIIPAVLHYLKQYHDDFTEKDIINFFLAAGAIAQLCKENASISGAEVGCQGEVGSAAAMAAAGLAEVLGGTPEQVENAAEIALEHNLGLTCDPIGGLVQIPCIERNAIAAMKAINATQIALRGDGKHVVSLDKVIKTMKETGADMQDKYKETARGGLAVNVVEC